MRSERWKNEGRSCLSWRALSPRHAEVEFSLHLLASGSSNSTEMLQTGALTEGSLMKAIYKIIIATSLALTFVTAAVAQEAQRTIGELEKQVSAGTATRDDQLQLARAYNQVGRYYEASKIARRLLDSDANDTAAAAVRDESSRGLQTLAQQRVDAATANANRSEATDEDRLALADAYFAAGDYRAAAEAYKKLPDPV